MMSDFEDDDVPWADPSIRADYEAALGQLILAHNEIDLRISRLIDCAIERLGGADALKILTQGDFNRRLACLNLLQALPFDLGIKSIDIAKLRDLNGQRNILAHGHFEQNPFDGSYDIVNVKREKASQYPLNRVRQLVEDLNNQIEDLRCVECFYIFSEEPVEPGR